MTPKKYTQNFHTQKKYSFYWKPKKNIEIQKLDPKKMDRAYVCMKISEYPPGVMPLTVYQLLKLFYEKWYDHAITVYWSYLFCRE